MNGVLKLCRACSATWERLRAASDFDSRTCDLSGFCEDCRPRVRSIFLRVQREVEKIPLEEAAERFRLMQMEELFEIHREWKQTGIIRTSRLGKTQPTEEMMREVDELKRKLETKKDEP